MTGLIGIWYGLVYLNKECSILNLPKLFSFYSFPPVHVFFFGKPGDLSSQGVLGPWPMVSSRSIFRT